MTTPTMSFGKSSRTFQHFHRSHGDVALEVFDDNFTTLFHVPAALVQSMPSNHAEIPRLILCRNYDCERPTTSCPLGAGCKFVHVNAPLSELKTSSVHVRCIWHHQDDCTYPRLPAGEMLCVSAPNERMPLESIPSDCVLATRGSLSRHAHFGQLSHCAHFHSNKLCKLGADCNFIHAVVVDPIAAPAGFALRALSNRCRKLIPLECPRIDVTMESSSSSSSNGDSDSTSTMPCMPLRLRLDEDCLSRASSAASNCTPRSPTPSMLRYRRDPYSFASPVVYL